MFKRLKHVNRPLTDDERQQAKAIRAGAEQDYPPVPAEQGLPPNGVPSQIEAARKRRGMTRYELGRLAGVPSTSVRSIEAGDDVPLSQFNAVVAALGLTIELVRQS